MKVVSRMYFLGVHAEGGDITEVEHAPPSGVGWRLERSHVLKFPYPRLMLVWVRDYSEGVKELVRALSHYANADWIEAEQDPAELARTTLEKLELISLEESTKELTIVGDQEEIYERTSAGDINNCALANSDEESNCQICSGRCPDLERFIQKPGQSRSDLFVAIQSERRAKERGYR